MRVHVYLIVLSLIWFGHRYHCVTPQAGTTTYYTTIMSIGSFWPHPLCEPDNVECFAKCAATKALLPEWSIPACTEREEKMKTVWEWLYYEGIGFWRWLSEQWPDPPSPPPPPAPLPPPPSALD